jgi:hypothetical protein
MFGPRLDQEKNVCECRGKQMELNLEEKGERGLVMQPGKYKFTMTATRWHCQHRVAWLLLRVHKDGRREVGRLLD